MREVKSVKVDNWGVFFLQKLQNFFNKTDYCDLTLQFNDNSQLKVHRLVLSACTDYFNVLEQTCEVIDDILIMPPGLQADVIVPIVNFMYTGTLEFEIDMYGRLLRTARDMNMTVLLKLLEAHKRTVDTSRAQQLRRVPKSFPSRRPAPAPAPQIRVDRTYNTSQSNNYNEPPRTVPVSAHQLRTLQIKPVAPSTSYYAPNVAEPASLVAKYAHSKIPMKGPSRFECNDETTLPPDSFEQFDSISYESKPLITANQASKEDIEDYDNLIPAHDTSSTFEQLRKSYTGSKRPASSVSSFESPPDKKPNIQDVKEYAEQQRMRKQITAEYDDDNEYDDVLDDEFHNDDDDEDYVPPAHLQKSMKKPGPSAVVIKQEKDQKPTIVVKDTVGSNVNHAKIISEVLKKYPHLVKNNKNIKLKIMAKSSTSPNQPQSIIIKQEPEAERPTSIQTQTIQRTVVKAVNTQQNPPKQQNIVQQRIVPAQAPVAVQTITHQQQQQQQHLKQPTQNVATPTTIQTQKVPVTTNPAPRRIDSKTMHALIALGAENTTGPWLCLRCGVNGRPISIPSYRGFRRHLINTHKEKVDVRLCEHCGWRSGNDTELYHHMKVQHSIAPPAGYDFPQCPFCPSICLNKAGLEQHLKEDHPDKILYEQHCMYCDGMFKDEDVLFNHMNTQHKAQAQKDGLIDYSDEEDAEYYSGDQATDKGIKILSNITISPQGAQIEPPTSKLGAESLSTVATGIAASLGLIDSSDSQEIQYLEETEFISATTSKTVQEPKFVNADGQIMDLTPEQRDEIISQLEGQPEGGVVMVLNDSFPSGAETGEADIKLESEDSTGLLGTFEEEKDKEPTKNKDRMDWQSNLQNPASKKKEETTHMDTEQPEEDPLKPDEDTSAHDESIENDEDQESVHQNENVASEEKEDEKEKLEKAKEKLKLLAGDWSDDEEELNDESANSTKETIESTGNTEEVESKEKQMENEHEEIIYETTTAKKADTEATTTSEISEKSVDDSKDKEEKAEEDVGADESTAADEKTASTEIEDSNKEQDNKSTRKSQQKDKSDSESEKIESNVKNASPKDKTETDAEETSSKQDDSTKSTAEDKKDEDGGDRIRTLISEWGDDEEEL